jgi:hypothetical protein
VYCCSVAKQSFSDKRSRFVSILFNRFKLLGHGTSYDEWTKNLDKIKIKESSKCMYCGKNDKITTELNGHKIYQTLRVPLQCSANNDGTNTSFIEPTKFRNTHDGGPPCTQYLHPGCAIWSRNAQNEYGKARRAWYSPSFEKEQEEPDDNNSDSDASFRECYCPLHANDMFLAGVEGSNMENRLPGPFESFVGSPKVKKSMLLIKAPEEPNLMHQLNDTSDEDDDDDLSESTSKQHKLKARRAAGKSERSAAKAPPPTSQTQKTGKASKKPTPKSSTAQWKQKTGHNYLVVAPDTNSRRLQRMQKVGEAVQIQAKKDGRLVSKRSSATATAIQDRVVGDSIQSLLDDLWKLRDAKGEPLGPQDTVGLRIQRAKQAPDQEIHKTIWGTAMAAFHRGERTLPKETLESEQQASPDSGDRKQAARRGNPKSVAEGASGHAARLKPKKAILDSDDEDFSQPTASNLQTRALLKDSGVGKPEDKTQPKQSGSHRKHSEASNIAADQPRTANLEAPVNGTRPDKRQCISSGGSGDHTNQVDLPIETFDSKEAVAKGAVVASTPLPNDRDESLAQSVFRDTAAELEPLEKLHKPLGTCPDAEVVKDIMGKHRKKWKIISGLSKGFEPVYKRAAELLAQRFSFLQLSWDPQPTTEPTSDGARAEAFVEALTASNPSLTGAADQEMGNHNNGTTSIIPGESAVASRQGDGFNLNGQENWPPVPNPWSHLFYGPDYKKEGFIKLLRETYEEYFEES